MKTSHLTAVALLIGAIAAFFVARGLGMTSSPKTGTPVIVAASTIEVGMPITAIQVKSMTWPTATAPEMSFDDSAKVVGRIAKQTLYSGEPILDSRLAPLDSKGGLSSVITPGKRAVSVRVNDVVAVAGFTLPGSYVDVMVSAKDGADNPFSKIVLNRVRVLAIAQETAQDQTKPRVVNAVTLELSPAESERLDLARSVGSLSLVLRNEMDVAEVDSKGSRMNDLLAGAGFKPSNRASAQATSPNSSKVPLTRFGIEEIRGIKRGAE